MRAASWLGGQKRLRPLPPRWQSTFRSGKIGRKRRTSTKRLIFPKSVLLSHALSLTKKASLWRRFSSNVTSARIANMARTSVHGSAYENMRFVYLASLFDDADRLLAAARRACNGIDACENRVAFMESGSKHGRLMAEG